MYAPVMDPIGRYSFRAPTTEDFDAVVAVLLADQRADDVEPTIDAHFLRQVWSRSSFDLAADGWVAIDAGRSIVAYGQVGREDGDGVWSWGVVHPEHRGRGIGSALLDRIEARASTVLAGVRRHGFATRSTPPIAPPPRCSRTGTCDRSATSGICRSTSMDRSNRDLHPTASRSLESSHATIFARPMASSRQPSPTTPSRCPSHSIDGRKSTRRARAYDPTLWLLARAGGVPVGALTASAGDDVGWVDYLAVLGSHRGRGIGSALLRRSFATFAARGLERVRLNVDAENVTGATAVYERVGMRVVNRWDLWERRT